MGKRVSALAFCAVLAALSAGAPAAADHTDPGSAIVPVGPGLPGDPLVITGDGTWEFIANFPAPTGNALIGAYTDHKVFRVGNDVYAAVGTLGQGSALHIGQRIIRLTNRGRVAPEWVADHGSAACAPANQSITGLQHDAAVAGLPDRTTMHRVAELPARSLAVVPEVLIDATDAAGRCHDAPGAGLELIDITGLGRRGFEPREIHLIRLPGFSHTVTVDERRPWIVYSSSSDFAGRPWIDVVNIRSCVGLGRSSLAQKRARCRPEVFRISFLPPWTQRRGLNGKLVPGTEAACHDITSRGNRIYCAGLNSTLIFDVRKLTNGRTRAVPGTALTCPRRNGTTTGARITDCAGIDGTEVPQAKGWRFLGRVSHAGRVCTPIPEAVSVQCNTNTEVPSDEGIAVAHEADPSPDGKLMFVTDERGGGVVPAGATCVPGERNPIGNGGMHVFDISNPSKIRYAKTPEGENAIWIGEPVVPAATFCTVHVFEQLPREQRFTVAYYTQGTKILDYFVDARRRVSFREVANIVLPGANTWAVDAFKIRTNRDGTRTYFLIASDIGRGIDILAFTAKPNPMGSKPPRARASSDARGRPAAPDLILLTLGLVAALARSGVPRHFSRKKAVG